MGVEVELAVTGPGQEVDLAGVQQRLVPEGLSDLEQRSNGLGQRGWWDCGTQDSPPPWEVQADRRGREVLGSFDADPTYAWI